MKYSESIDTMDPTQEEDPLACLLNQEFPDLNEDYSITNILESTSTTETVDTEAAYVKIVEQPATNSYRFRYRSEGERAGTIPGLRQLKGRRSFPKIMVCNHEGPALLEICCLTEDLRVHPNNLVKRSLHTRDLLHILSI